MGLPEKLIRARRPSDEAGVALPVALLGILLIGAMGVGIWVTVATGARSTENREVSAESLQLAEAGMAHATLVLRDHLDTLGFDAILRGSDGVADNADDGVLAGYGLASDLEIPPAGRSLGGGTYVVRVVDDPADLDGDSTTDSNLRLLIRSTGTMPFGGSATVEVVLNDGPSVLVPSFVTEGTLTVDGNPRLVGSCGGIHGNADVVVTGNLTVTQTVAAVGDVAVSGSITRPDGTDVSPQTNQPEIEIPDYSDPVTEFCSNGEGDYILQADGFVLDVAANELHDARTNKWNGWKRSEESPVSWTFSGSSTPEGTYCAHGNVSISGNPDGPIGPLPMTVIASKSIDISGNPQIRSSHPEDILLMAGGDIRISGNLAGDPGDYSGLIYARSQCDVRGNAHVSSRVLCRDQTNASGTHDLVDANGLGGNVELDYACSATAGLSGPRQAVSWSQRIGY